MPSEDRCSHCQEFGVEGHIASRLKLHKLLAVEVRDGKTFDRGVLLLHTRCICEWLVLHPDHAIADPDVVL